MDKPPFAQTFVGAVLAAVLAGLIVWFLTGRKPIHVEVTAASAATTPVRPQETSSDVVLSSVLTPRPHGATETFKANPRNLTADACLQAVINDPDHYTNVRSGPSTNREVVARVVDSEVFCVTAQKGRWWTIRTARGVDGYIYHDRVRFITPGQ